MLIVAFFLMFISLTASLPLLFGYTGWPGRDRTEWDGTDTGSGSNARWDDWSGVRLLFFYALVSLLASFHLLDLLLFRMSLFLRGEQQQAGRGGTGRDGTDAGGNSNTERVEGGGQRVHMLLFFCSCFSAFILFFVSLFCVSDYLFSDKYINRRGTNAKRRPDGTGYTRAAIATWDGTEGADGATGTSSFIFVSCRLSSFILIILLLF